MTFVDGLPSTRCGGYVIVVENCMHTRTYFISHSRPDSKEELELFLNLLEDVRWNIWAVFNAPENGGLIYKGRYVKQPENLYTACSDILKQYEGNFLHISERVLRPSVRPFFACLVKQWLTPKSAYALQARAFLEYSKLLEDASLKDTF